MFMHLRNLNCLFLIIYLTIYLYICLFVCLLMHACTSKPALHCSVIKQYKTCKYSASLVPCSLPFSFSVGIMKITLAHPFAIHFTGLYVAAYDVLYTPRYIHGIVSRLTRVCCCGCSVSEVAWLQFHHQTVAVAALMNSVHVVVICVTFSLQVIL